MKRTQLNSMSSVYRRETAGVEIQPMYELKGVYFVHDNQLNAILLEKWCRSLQ